MATERVIPQDVGFTATQRRAEVDVQVMLRSNSRQRAKPPVPSFISSLEVEQLCLSILSLARGDGFAVSLVNDKRAPWFTAKVPSFLRRVVF